MRYITDLCFGVCAAEDLLHSATYGLQLAWSVTVVNSGTSFTSANSTEHTQHQICHHLVEHQPADKIDTYFGSLSTLKNAKKKRDHLSKRASNVGCVTTH